MRAASRRGKSDEESDMPRRPNPQAEQKALRFIALGPLLRELSKYALGKKALEPSRLRALETLVRARLPDRLTDVPRDCGGPEDEDA
jgi:hypothetical protein